TGYIVNVHDTTNFDIDLSISDDIREKYESVISNQYTYRDINIFDMKITNKAWMIDKHYANANNQSTNGSDICNKIGIAYRCRLRGIGINQENLIKNMGRSKQICMEVRQLIDRTDGWIMCTLSDIDIYRRLLVDIVIHTATGDV